MEDGRQGADGTDETYGTYKTGPRAAAPLRSRLRWPVRLSKLGGAGMLPVAPAAIRRGK